MGVEIAAIHGKLVLEDGFSSPSDKLLGLIPKLTSAIDSLTSKIDSIGKRSSASVPKAADDTEKLKAAYDKLSARIDPVVAGQQKLANATSILEAAHKKGLITHEQYTEQLEKANKKFSDTTSWVEKLSKVLGGEIGSKFSALTEFASKFGGETGKALEEVGSKAGGAISGLSELGASLGPLLPLAVAFAAALLAIGVAFEAFGFIKDAVEEGLKLQGVIERLNDSLRNTGSYSGLSSHEIIELAGSYALLTGRTKEEEIAAALVLTRFKNLNEQAYPKALDAVNAYARALGITAEEGAKKLGPLLDGNTRSLRAAKEAGIDLTTGQQAMLKSMVDTGNIAGYQSAIFAILKEKVGLAAGAHETLGIQAGRARFVMGELKEGIASELIPALEDLAKDIVNQLGGWDYLKEKASAFGHFLGNILRTIIYGVIVDFHALAIAWDNVVLIIDKGLLFLTDHIHSFADMMASVPGPFSALWQGLAKGTKNAFDNIKKDIADTTGAIDKHKKAIDAAIAGYQAHRQALEGDTDVNKKHKSAQDDVASTQKKLNDLIGEGLKAIQAYTDKLSDLADKLIEQNKEEVALYTALQNGLEAYYRELLTQERRKAVLAQVTELTKAHRTEVEKLQEQLNKANDEKRTVDAAKLKGMIDASNDSFERQKKAVGDLAGENVDLKHSTDALLESNKSNLDYTGKQVEAWAQLTDALTGTSTASREASVQADISKRVLDSLKHTQEDLSASITETVRREHEFTDSMKDALDVAKELNKLSNQASLQTAISHIDSSLPQYLQKVEEQYLQIVAGIGKGSVEEGQRIIDATERVFESLGISIGSISDRIKGDLQKIQDAQTLKSISGASKTPYDIYKEERDNIVRVMEETTHNVSLTVEQRAQIEKDGNAAILALDRERYESILSNASGALDFLAAHFGSFFAQLKSLVDGLQQAQGFGKNVSGLVSGFGGSGQLAGAAGGIATVVGIFAVVYDFVDKMIKARNALKMGTLSSLEVVGGNWSSPSYFNETGRKFDVALRNLIQSILDSIHGVLTDLPQITIRARADGKKFAAYVAGVFVGEFDSAQEAMENAVAAAIASGKFTNLSEELKRALEASIGKTLDELQANIKTANDAIADRLGELGNSFVENIDKYLQRIEAERKLGLSTEATTQAMIRSIEAYKNQVLGIDTTASDRLAALRSLDQGMKEASGSIEAELQKRIQDIMDQIAALENQSRHPNDSGGKGGNGGGGSSAGAGNDNTSGDPFTKQGQRIPDSPEDEALRHLREVLAQYTAELDKIPKALTDQQINMGIFDTLYQYLQQSPKYAKQAAEWAKIKVQIEFEQIKAQLMLLGKWEEFQAMFNDAYNAALAAAGKAPGKGGKGGGKKDDSVQSFIDGRRFQLQLAGMDSYHQRLAQIQRDYDEQIKAAGKNKKEREELLALEKQEIALAKQQNQADVMSRFNELIGKNDPFTQIQVKFADMANDLKNAGFGAKRLSGLLADLSKAEAEAIHTLAQQDLGNLFSNLSNYIDDQATKQQATLASAQIKYQLDMMSYKADFELLKAKGALTQKEIDQVQSLFDYIDAHPPDFTPKSLVPNTYEYGQAVLQDQQNYLASIGKDAASLKSAMDLLKSYQSSTQDALTSALTKIRTDFTTISNALGDTAEVISAKNNAISKAISDFLQPITDFRKGMDTNSGTSTLTGAQQFSSIQSQFRALVSHATLADRDQLLSLADQYRTLGRQATVGQGYRFIDQEIKNALDSFSSMVGTQAQAQLGTGSNPMSMAAPQLQQAVELGNSMIVSRLDNQNNNTATTNSLLVDLNNKLASGLSVRNVA